MRKKEIFILIVVSFVSFVSCQSAPKNYTYFYRGEYTGLDTLIDIEGYYVTQRGCDSTFFSVFMFYPDGLFTIATTSQLLPELIDCFTHGGKSRICRYPLWGTYRICGDTIRTQAIITDGSGCTVFRDYKILDNKQIENISDYVEPQATNLGYMRNYPSLESNICRKPALFYSLKTKRSKEECPFIGKKWFWENKDL